MLLLVLLLLVLLQQLPPVSMDCRCRKGNMLAMPELRLLDACCTSLVSVAVATPESCRYMDNRDPICSGVAVVHGCCCCPADADRQTVTSRDRLSLQLLLLAVVMVHPRHPRAAAPLEIMPGCLPSHTGGPAPPPSRRWAAINSSGCSRQFPAAPRTVRGLQRMQPLNAKSMTLRTDCEHRRRLLRAVYMGRCWPCGGSC